jgi:predicted negative regulator of RcsB-dependent stress response
LELMVSEDGLKFNEYEDRFQARLDKKFKSPGNDVQFLEAEMHLHWAFIYLKFGHEFDAALHLRQAFQIADECRKKSPDYLPIKKTIGLLEIMIGSVPEKYGWILGLLGINGSIEGGLNSLNLVKTSKSPFAFEADLLYSIIQGFILQQPQIGLEELKKVIKSNPDNNLLLFLAGSLAIKNSESETALTFLDSINADHGLPLYYADYLKGEVFLHKGQYLNSISSYHWFIDHYKGQNYIKDAYYKIALCHWLNGNKNEALILFKNARSKGKEATEADKYAARSLADNELPNVKLSKARYATDGGYYEQARQILSEILPAEIPHQRDQVEFYYRKARLAHKTNQLPAARLFYLQTIEMADEKNWYFAPNAALQLGYISLAENNRKEAKGYFEKALTYKKHEYKNSIDSKAKTALAQIKRK